MPPQIRATSLEGFSIGRRCEVFLLGLMAELRGQGGTELRFAKADAAIRIRSPGGEFAGTLRDGQGDVGRTAAPRRLSGCRPEEIQGKKAWNASFGGGVAVRKRRRLRLDKAPLAFCAIPPFERG